ncbi:restriction endonuclease subunit S [Mediterraneibacter faecis]|uniref:restriction endonuclease subunit S n=1 Tax=Mediterraneibacter faecis TaxID=592978 RepID=UPI0032BF728A
MSKWTKTTLGKIADIITGPFGSQLHQSDYVKRGIPIVMPQDIGNRNINYSTINYVSEEDATRLKRYSTVANDILYARRGDVEKHAFVRAKDAGVLCGTGCLRVRINSNEVEPAFLSFYLNREETRKWLVTHAVGTNMPNLNTDILSDVPIAYPTLKEQRKNVKVLNCLEERIVLNEKINDNLTAMAYDIYMHSFFSKKPNAKLKDILVEADKSSVQVGEAKQSTGEYPFFTSGSAILKWDTPFIDGRNCFLNTGGNADVKFYVGEAAYSTDTWCISANNNMSDYLYLLLVSIKPELNQKFFQGTGLKHLQKPLLKDRPIYIPDFEELKTFNEQVTPMFNIISENTRENQELITLRDWLLPMLMNGQATISD